MSAKVARAGVEAARRKFTPEFMNRIDKTVVFRPLGQPELQKILNIELSMVQQRVFNTSDRAFVFTLKNETGALFRAMAVFALRDIDLSKIESRPLGGHPWEYSFYVDFTGNLAEARVQHALAHLAEFAHHIKVLGCYQHAALPEC